MQITPFSDPQIFTGQVLKENVEYEYRIFVVIALLFPYPSAVAI